jgi:hypothetical protein
MTETTALYEDKKDAEKGDGGFVRAWVDQWNLAGAGPMDKWCKAAELAFKAYRGDKSSKQTDFNIFHSNVETLVPALYNSTPAPDVRRRYNDPDPVAKAVCDVLERALSHSVDAYDFDTTMETAATDLVIVDRGVVRVKYEAEFYDEPVMDEMGQPVLDEAGEPVTEQRVDYEEVRCEYVPWKHFRHGPARVWDEVPWIAFEHFLSKDEVKRISPKLAGTIPYSYGGKEGGDEGDETDKESIFKRAKVLEFWDKETREVIFICPEYLDAPLAKMPDPLKLQRFFCIPRPMMAIGGKGGDLTPCTSLSIYEKLVAELNEVQRRIIRLTKQLRPRGLYAGAMPEMRSWTEADDGELVPVSGSEMSLTTGGADLDKLISWFPLEPTAMALKQLIEQRELIKQSIYEITGVSDILRGASDSAETATAQQIKSQWGSLRIQRMQREVARFARDLFEIKAEIMATEFSIETFGKITGLKFPSKQEQQQAQQELQMGMQQAQQMQAQGAQVPPEMMQQKARIDEILAQPAIEDIEALMRDDVLRGFRVDIESDSTIRADVVRNQQQMAQFLQGTAQYMQAMGPLLMQKPELAEPVAIIYAAFARQFKLGKQAEDALERMTEAASKPAEPKPDPEEKKVEAQMKLNDQKMQHAEKKAQVDMQKAQIGLQVEEAKAGIAINKMQAQVEADTMRAMVPQPAPFQGQPQ